MGIRSVIRDIISIYLGYKILKGYIVGEFSITTNIFIAALLVLLFSVWFLLEKIGVIPKIT